MKRRVLVTDGEQRAALAVVRSLGRAGWEVHVCSSRSHSLAGASRYCARSHHVSDALTDPHGFLLDLGALVTATEADVLLPISEASLLAVLPNRRGFRCAIPFPAARDFEAICDKSKVLEGARRHGIAVPDQTILEDPDKAAARVGDLRFPVVLKPSRSVAGEEGARVRAGVSYAMNEADARRAIARIPVNAYPVLVQQQIKGPGFGISVLVSGGELVAAFAHRRLREKPPSGGVSVLRESIPLDKDLLSRSLAVLADFNWQGVAMVEFKLDTATGIPFLMEINGRLWGSLQLAIDAGVDFPRLLAELAMGGEPTPVLTYKVGVRSRWEWGDVDHLLASVLRPAVPGTAGDGTSRLEAVSNFIRGFGPGNRAEIFRREDPAPILRETLDWFLRR